MSELSEAVKAAVELAPGSLRALARAADVPHSTLVHIVHGKREATPELARKVATALEAWSATCGETADRIRQSLPTS